jgi:hypothetical protein
MDANVIFGAVIDPADGRRDADHGHRHRVRRSSTRSTVHLQDPATDFAMSRTLGTRPAYRPESGSAPGAGGISGEDTRRDPDTRREMDPVVSPRPAARWRPARGRAPSARRSRSRADRVSPAPVFAPGGRPGQRVVGRGPLDAVPYAEPDVDIETRRLKDAQAVAMQRVGKTCGKSARRPRRSPDRPRWIPRAVAAGHLDQEPERPSSWEPRLSHAEDLAGPRHVRRWPPGRRTNGEDLYTRGPPGRAGLHAAAAAEMRTSGPSERDDGPVTTPKCKHTAIQRNRASARLSVR